MDLFEYQARELLTAQTVAVPNGFVINSAIDEPQMPFPLVLKAQVKVGGRGKAGGVKFVKNNDEYSDALNTLFNMQIKGHQVETVLAVSAATILQEMYLSILIDRSSKNYVLVFSQDGGMEIEELAKSNPEKIHKLQISPIKGLDQNDIRIFLAAALGISENNEKITQLVNITEKLFNVFKLNDCTLVEINPLAFVKDGENERVMTLDAKISIDDNAKFRHAEIFQKYADQSGEKTDDFGNCVHTSEFHAKENCLSYVSLDGEVGIIGNGAGLVMSTLDLVSFAGGEPANFLDIGGGASAEHMKNALEVVLLNKKVRVVLINIFGGLTQCDLVAQGILSAFVSLAQNERRPMVVRFAGNRAEEGLQILAQACEKDETLATLIQFTNSFDHAASLAAQISKEQN